MNQIIDDDTCVCGHSQGSHFGGKEIVEAIDKGLTDEQIRTTIPNTIFKDCGWCLCCNSCECKTLEGKYTCADNPLCDCNCSPCKCKRFKLNDK